MATNNTLKPERLITIPEIATIDVVQDVKFFGFNTKMTWSYDDDRVILFKIFRYKLSRPLLEKNHKISQIALERLASVRQFRTENTILFNKNVFSQNKFVNFFQSNSTRFDKKEEDIKSYTYSEIGTIRKNKSGRYEFFDRNIKYGETYAYAISALGLNLVSSPKSTPVNINIEDIKAPKKPSKTEVRKSKMGILLFLGTSEPQEVKSFLVYKKNKEEKEFSFLAEVEKIKKDKYVSFVDFSAEPGKNIIYKVYSVDLFDNISYQAEYIEVYNDYLFPNKISQKPKFKISGGNNFIRIVIKKDTFSQFARIRRNDAWRRELGFELKTNRGVQWSNFIQFTSNEITFDDLSVKSGRRYKYEITLIDDKGLDMKSFTTPYLEINDNLEYSSFQEEDVEKENEVKIDNISADVVNTSTVKLSWNISGMWDFLILKINGTEELKIENIHNIAYLFNLKQERINITAELIYKGNIVDRRENIIVSL